MVLNMDINKEMYIWVESIFQKNKYGIVVDGNSFDDELGFGLEKRKYEGKFIQISKNGRIMDNGKIDMIHYSHFGLKWIVNNTTPFLDTPFLLTDNLSIDLVYSGAALLTPSCEAKKSFEKYPNNSFAIVSKQCVGNLRVEKESFYFDIFSDKSQKVMDIEKEIFSFAGYTSSIGRIDFSINT